MRENFYTVEVKNKTKKPRGSQRKIRYLPGIYVHMQPLNVMIECNLGYIRLKKSLYLYYILSESICHWSLSDTRCWAEFSYSVETILKGAK